MTSRGLAQALWGTCVGQQLGATSAALVQGSNARKSARGAIHLSCLLETPLPCVSFLTAWFTLAAPCSAWFVVWWHCHLPTCISIWMQWCQLLWGSTMQQNKFWQSALYYACLQYAMKHVTIKLFSFNLFWYMYVVQCFLFPLAIRFFTVSHWSSPWTQGAEFWVLSISCPFQGRVSVCACHWSEASQGQLYHNWDGLGNGHFVMDTTQNSAPAAGIIDASFGCQLSVLPCCFDMPSPVLEECQKDYKKIPALHAPE